FPVVVVAGLEEGLFPHASALETPRDLEEERRLFYVALTRARDEVLLTAAAYRRRMLPGGGVAARGGAISRVIGDVAPQSLERKESAAMGWAGADAEGAGWSRSGGEGGAGDAWRRGSQATHHRHRKPGARKSADVSGPAYRTSGALAHTIGREVHHDTFGR